MQLSYKDANELCPRWNQDTLQMFHVAARNWDLEHSCNTDSRVMLNFIKKGFENKFVRFVKFLSTSAEHGRNVHKENNFFFLRTT